jgi:hypothetical protein
MKSKGVSGSSGTLAQEIANGYAQKRGLMLPTPETQGLKVNERGKQKFIRLDLLPTPTAGEAEKYRLQYTPGSQMGTSLSAMAASNLLPTPTQRDYQPPYNPEAMVRKNGKVINDQLSTLPTMLGLKERGGMTFRLSPLFTQEMMGFPLGWTEFPFLPQCNQEPTETATSPVLISENGEKRL